MSSPPCNHGHPTSLSRRKQNRYDGAIQTFCGMMQALMNKKNAILTRGDVCLLSMHFLQQRPVLVEQDFFEYLKSQCVTTTLSGCASLEADNRDYMQTPIYELASVRREIELIYLLLSLEYFLRNYECLESVINDGSDAFHVFAQTTTPLVTYRDVIRFLARRCECDCLMEINKQAKKCVKTLVCSNVEHCRKLIPRNQCFTCGACRNVDYCSLECQRIDWKTKHKDVCRLNKLLKRAAKDSEAAIREQKVHRAKHSATVGKLAVMVDAKKEATPHGPPSSSSESKTKSSNQSNTKTKRLSNKKKKQQQRKNKHKK